MSQTTNSPIASQMALVLAGFIAGCSLSYLFINNRRKIKSTGKRQKEAHSFNDELSDSNSESSAETGSLVDESCKLVLVIRTDLGMTKGKVAAQCCHATLACYKAAARSQAQYLDKWEYEGQAKITLKCNSEEEMLELQEKARAAGLIGRSIQDAGRTQIAAGSRTVLGIGPGPISLINEVTGHLKLY
ncbi:hypothetical protein DSO57_1001917 [Entomophthora muscae]|uniref:Uncharacterized protein n=1 Tax=Entomophthora muscae TaxID=34485 RepID=A0ACC2UHS3_9FUNG|nr:hypothetical protein DSO57_1001917 [Entomophthora muscae]